MKSGDYTYAWQGPDWPNWRCDLGALTKSLAAVSLAQGHLLGRMADVATALRDQASLEALTQDVIKTSEIEGEKLDAQSVRSSLARRLGVDIGALAPADRHVEGLVDMVLDATTHCHRPLTTSRLFSWHAALFPTGYSGMTRIRVAAFRDAESGPMQVVSGPVGRRHVHFEAPPAERLEAEMTRLLNWLERDMETPPLLKAGLAHLWFVTIHPFEDGNGRMARAIGDMWLARADGAGQRFYSLSAQIQRERNAYYDMLERTQKGSMDVTEWLTWFLACLERAVQGAEQTLDAVLVKARHWRRWAGMSFNARQVKMLNRLLDGFEGKLTNRKWAAITKCSADTALRDINELISLGVLRKTSSGGRSTAYELA